MRIKKISLKNFQFFQEIDLRLSPLTVLTGANSSGEKTGADTIRILSTTSFAIPKEA